LTTGLGPAADIMSDSEDDAVMEGEAAQSSEIEYDEEQTPC